jgi:WD40 repeat protein
MSFHDAIIITAHGRNDVSYVERVGTFSLLRSKLERTAYLNNTQVLISGSWDKSVHIYDLYSFTKTMKISCGNGLICCATRISSSRIATGSTDNIIRVWDIRSGKYLFCLKGHLDGVRSLCSLSIDTIASGSYDHKICVWSLDSGKCIKTLLGHTDRVFCVIKLVDGSLCSTGFDKSIKIWDVATSKCTKTIRLLRKARILTQLDESRIAVGDGPDVKIFSLGTGKCLQVLSVHTDDIMSMTLLSSGDLVTLGWDKAMRIWDLNISECTKVYSHVLQLRAIVEISFDRFITGDQGGNIHVWDAKTFKMLKTIKAHTEAIDVLLL